MKEIVILDQGKNDFLPAGEPHWILIYMDSPTANILSAKYIQEIEYWVSQNPYNKIEDRVYPGISHGLYKWKIVAANLGI